MQKCFVKRKKRRRLKRIVITTVLVAFILGYLFISLNVNPILETVAEEKVRAITTTAVNTSLQKVMGESVGFTEVLDVVTDSSGDISLLKVNTVVINSIAQKTVLASQELISSLGEQGIGVPIGTLSGITIFSGKGADVNIKVYLVGTISSYFESSFVPAGINQTRHLVTLYVESEVKVVIPGANRTITTLTDAILCENIIVGKVPNVYLGLSNVTELLDLVPR